jgi:hypothetical protein
MKKLNILSKAFRVVFVWTCFICILFIAFLSMNILEYKNNIEFNVMLLVLGLIALVGIWTDPLCRKKVSDTRQKKSVDIK